MWRERIVARTLLRLNAPTDPEVRERVDDLRPLWIFARAACALALLALAWAITEFTIVLGFAAQDAPAFEPRLTFSAFLFVSWAGLFAYLASEIAWLGIATFAMVVAVSGTLLEARPLAIVVGYASAAHAVAVFGGGFSMHAHDPLGGPWWPTTRSGTPRSCSWSRCWFFR